MGENHELFHKKNPSKSFSIAIDITFYQTFKKKHKGSILI